MQYKILMCAPDYYGVHYAINPWMKAQIGNANKALAKEQWENLCSTIQKYADVDQISPQADLPDMVFTANAAFVLNQKTIVSSFRHKERQGEEPLFMEWLSNKTECTKLSCNFEGGGDALADKHYKCIWFGYEQRSSIAAKDDIEQFFNIPVIPLKLINPLFYHLDTCLCPLPRGYILHYPKAFGEQSLALLQKTAGRDKLIAVSEADANNFACNAVCIGDVIILNEVSPALRSQLESLRYTIVETRLSEFIKAGGAARCLTLRLDESWDI